MEYLHLILNILKQLVIQFFREILGENDDEIYWPDAGGPRFPH